MRKIEILLLIGLLILGTLTSCEKEDPKPTVQNPIATLVIVDNGDGTYLLDASTSENADEIKWSIPGVIETPVWEEFLSNDNKTITVPDPIVDYTVTVSVKNVKGENSISKILAGTPVVLTGLELFISDPDIADAIAANEMDIYFGDDPLNLTGTYEVLKKENHKVKIDGVVGDFEEESWFEYSCGNNWRSFLCEISSSEILSSYGNGMISRRVDYKIQGSGNKFTIYFQSEVNPWFTKLNGTYPYEYGGNYYYENTGVEMGSGFWTVSGEKFTNGSIKLSCLWVEDESASGVKDWSYNEFYVEPESSNYEIFTDVRDNRKYKTVKIGNQTWFAENLKYEPTESGFQKWIEGTDNDGDDKFYTWAEESETSKELGGIAYTWTAATGYHVDTLIPSGEVIQGICPEGWHIPTAAEWKELVDYLGEDVAGGKLRSRTGHLPEGEMIWGQNVPPTNETGFNFGPSCYVNGMYHENLTAVVGRGMLARNNILIIGDAGEINYAIVGNFDGSSNYSESIPGGPKWHGKFGGFVIRCVKDSE